MGAGYGFPIEQHLEPQLLYLAPPAKGKDSALQMSRGNFCPAAQGPAPSFDDSGRVQCEGKAGND